jgi:hypothetical protein
MLATLTFSIRVVLSSILYMLGRHSKIQSAALMPVMTLEAGSSSRLNDWEVYLTSVFMLENSREQLCERTANVPREVMNKLLQLQLISSLKASAAPTKC